MKSTILAELSSAGGRLRLGAKTTAKKLGMSFWERIGAFANTRGGEIVLGITEEDGIFSPASDCDLESIRSQVKTGFDDGSYVRSTDSDEHREKYGIQ